MRIALIANPVAGRGRTLDVLPRVITWAEKQKIGFDFFSTTGPGDAISLAKFCKYKRYERIVLLGGDGTVNEVGSALLDSDIVVGVIPTGSGNDFYRMLGNNGGLESGFRTAFFGKPGLVDVGLINERPFFNSVGIGFDAAVALEAARSTRQLPGIMVYLTAVFRTLPKLKPIDIDLELDKFSTEARATLVCVGNGRSSGGGFLLTPQARIDDGLFDICLIDILPKRKIFTYLPRTLNGTHVRLPGVKIFRSRKIMINSLAKMPVHIDGEVLAEGMEEIEFSMDSRKLKVAMAVAE
jgi:diacylglycerol kinase (ATP)